MNSATNFPVQPTGHRRPFNPLSLPAFLSLNSTVVEVAPKTKNNQRPLNAPCDLKWTIFGYGSELDEHDYMTFKYQWGRLVLTPVLFLTGIGVFAVPLGFHRENWFRWWAFYYDVILAGCVYAIAIINAVIIFFFRNEPRLSVTAVRLYEACIVACGLLWCGVASSYYFTIEMCAKDRASVRQDTSVCLNRMPDPTLLGTLLLTCFVPCRAVLAVTFGFVLFPLLTFILRLVQPSDNLTMLYTKLALVLVITLALAVLCVRRGLAQRKRYEVSRDIAAYTAKIKETQRLAIATLEAMFPPQLVPRLVRGLSLNTASRGVAVGVCDIGDLSLLSCTLSPTQIVLLLNGLAFAFEKCVEQHKGEMLRSFGDRYAFTVGLLTLASSRSCEAVMHATAIAEMFLTIHQSHPDVRDLLGSNRASMPLRMCIGFGACAGGIVGVHSISYETYSPALTAIDSFLLECPTYAVMGTEAAASHCPQLYGELQQPALAVQLSCGNDILLFRSEATQDGMLSPIGVLTDETAEGATERRHHSELAGAIFRWGAELGKHSTQLARDAPHADDEMEQAKDVLLDCALRICPVQSPSNNELETAEEQLHAEVLIVDGAHADGGDRSVVADLFLQAQNARNNLAHSSVDRRNYVASITNLFRDAKVQGKVIPRKFGNSALELLFENYERPFMLGNMAVLVCIIGIVHAALLVVITSTSPMLDPIPPAIPILVVGIAVSAGTAVLLLRFNERLCESRCTARLSILQLLLTVVLMGVSYASLITSRMKIFTSNTVFIAELHTGVIAACSTRFSHAVLLSVLNAVANVFVMRNSQDFTPFFLAILAISTSAMCIFTPLDAERHFRSSFELAIVASAIRRDLYDELAVASAVVHHTLPNFVVRRVLYDGRPIANLMYLFPNICVLAIRVDGFSHAVCDGLLLRSATESPTRTIYVAAEFLGAVEDCINSAVKQSFAAEAALPSELSGDRDKDEQEMMEEAGADILVKVRAFGDKIVIFGPLVEGATDRHLRVAARAMLLAMEHIHVYVSASHPTCVATSIATLDSGLMVVLGQTTCTPSLMGVAARQADLCVRAAPDGYHGISDSLAKSISNCKLSLPLAGCQWAVSEQGECWRVRGAGTLVLRKLAPPPLPAALM